MWSILNKSTHKHNLEFLKTADTDFVLVFVENCKWINIICIIHWNGPLPLCQNKQKASQSARWSDLRFLIKAATAVLSSPPKYLPTPPCLTVFVFFVLSSLSKYFLTQRPTVGGHILRRRAPFVHLGFENSLFCTHWCQRIANTHQLFIACFKCGGPSQPNFTHSYCSYLSAVQEVNLDISFSGPHFSFQNLLVSYRILVSNRT